MEESKRPLSLPPKNWGVSIGHGPEVRSVQGESEWFLLFQGNIPYGYLHQAFAYPHLPLFNDNVELHFPLHLKIYPIRNVEVIDSTLCINGPNWALGGGVHGISISEVASYISWNICSQLKVPLRKQWVFSDMIFKHRMSNEISIETGIGIGFQINRNLYLTSELQGFYWRKEYTLGHYATNRTSLEESYSLSLPIQAGINIDKRWKFFVFTRPIVFSYDSYLIGGGLGFDYYW